MARLSLRSQLKYEAVWLTYHQGIVLEPIEVVDFPIAAYSSLCQVRVCRAAPGKHYRPIRNSNGATIENTTNQGIYINLQSTESSADKMRLPKERVASKRKIGNLRYQQCRRP